MQIRHATPEDYDPIAQLLRAEMGEWAPTASELAHDDADPTAVYGLRLLAVEDHDVIAQAVVDQLPPADEGSYTLDLRAHPNWQGRGYGSALFQATMAELAPRQPRQIIVEVWQTGGRGHRFFLERGFIETWRRVDSELDVAQVDLAPYATLEASLAQRGIAISTYAQLAHDAERDRKLHELNEALWQDVPFGMPAPPRTLDHFVHNDLHSADFLPDACFVAVHGNDYIGYSKLLQNDGFLHTDMTGVLPSFRGLGIATALKVAGIRYARQRHLTRLTTTNDTVNTAMLGLNQKLGFAPFLEGVRYVWRASG